MPEHARGLTEPDVRLGADIDEQCHRDPERVAEPGQRGQVRVGPALLQRDEHALADPGAGRELVQ
jgi:hypothetical protein